MYRNIENANFQLLHDLAQKVVEEGMAVSDNGEQFLPTHNLYNTQNNVNHNNVYQNYTTQQTHMATDQLMQSYDQLPQSLSTSLPSFSNNYSLEQESQPHSSFELMAQLAADLADVHVPAHNVNVSYDNNESTYFKSYKEPQERSLLQSSMSPLLAAVNDITKRDAELQLYLNQSFEKQHDLLATVEDLEEALKTEEPTNTTTTCALITDKPVPCRARASLPTRFLRLGEVNPLTNEPAVFAKKFIVHPTKFGPVEGVTRFVSTLDLDVLHIQVPRFYPLLQIDEAHILDVSNDETSNWMRYIRLAETAETQNLHVLLENGRIYYKTTRAITAQEELRVGYSSTYGARFVLPVLMTTEVSKADSTLKDTRLRERKPKTVRPTELSVEKPAKTKQQLYTARRLKRAAQRQQEQETLRKENKIRRNLLQALKKDLYKCDLCTRRCFSLEELTLHRTKHATEPPRTHICHICQQKCSTPSALKSHIKGHTENGFVCIYCEEQFNYVRDFNQHVMLHRTEDNQYACVHCKKLYAAYHLVRKHVRLFHTGQKRLSCNFCNKMFSNTTDLQRHNLTHGNEKPHGCEQCSKTFLRKDNLLMHMRRMHGLKNNSKTADVELPEKSMQEQQVEVVNKPEEHAMESMICSTKNKENGNTNNIFSASSSNRRKQTPTKLKTLEQKLDTLDYVPLSELLTPYLMSEQELHEEFEKAEIEATFSTSNHKTEYEEKRTHEPSTKELEEKCIEAVRPQSSTTLTNNFACHICSNLNFKRRGILVNHLAKCHPEVDLDTVEALNKPILKQKMLYYCCYCKNVYHSARKRRLHILKHHPGRALPANKLSPHEATHVQSIGQQEEDIHKCEICPRQYAARSRLVAHYRKMHVDAEIPAKPWPLTSSTEPQVYEEPLMGSNSPENKLLKLSSAALELSRYDVYNERSADEFQRLPSLFDETPLVGMDGLMERYNHRSIEQQFFEKIGKL